MAIVHIAPYVKLPDVPPDSRIACLEIAGLLGKHQDRIISDRITYGINGDFPMLAVEFDTDADTISVTGAVSWFGTREEFLGGAIGPAVAELLPS